MATEEELFSQVEEAVREVLNTDEGQIKMETLFRADLETESVDFLDISFEIEKRTGVELDFPTALKFLGEQKGSEITDIAISDLVGYLMFVKNKQS